MKTTDTMRRRLSIALAALPAACAVRLPSEPLPARTLPPPTVRAGDRWTYAGINQFMREPRTQAVHTVTEVGAHIVVRIEDPYYGSRVERYAGPWNAVVDATYDMPIHFAEPMPLLPPTGDPGARAIDSTYWTNPDYPGLRFRWSQTLRSRGWERVTVPAGTFDALRVTRRMWFDHPGLYRIRSERWETLWYAPAVNRWVAREWSGEFIEEPMIQRFRWLHREDWLLWQLTGYTPAAT
ncbi:MAG TPA: hypothetical protein VM491_20710 [Burkholderiaceae bacterium]|jgi:hypothetical protein|nr:hypothetical protein [Burkholderiaceae bacterium]